MKKKFLTIGVLFLFFSLFMNLKVVSSAEESDHNFFDVPNYYGIKYIDQQYHNVPYLCSDEGCGYAKYVKEPHEKTYTYYAYVDNAYHNEVYDCMSCGHTEIPVGSKEKHSGTFMDEYKKADLDYHKAVYNCDICDENYYVTQKHNWKKTTAKKIDSTYCQESYKCKDCGQTKTGDKIKHELSDKATVTKKATISKNGKSERQCKWCKTVVSKSFAWKYGKAGCLSYDVKGDGADIFTTSKSLTISLKNPLKNSVIKVKIGNKTYSKTVKNTSAKQTVKIKASSCGKKYTIKIYYKGKLIGKQKYYSYSDEDKETQYGRVMIENMKKGLTEKQVRYVAGFGNPISKRKSGGMTIWVYEGGEVRFKNGKVVSWK